MPSPSWCCCMIAVLLSLAREGCLLKCELCRYPEDECHGPLRLCYSFLDQCGTFQSRNNKGGKVVSRKACVQANICDENVTILDLGRRGIISSKLTCCKGAACWEALPPLPPVNTTLNGKKCQSCFVKRSSYCLWEETIQCKGDQTHCLEIAGFSDWGGFGSVEILDESIPSLQFALKGCVNPAFCEVFHEGSVYFATMFLIGEGSCKPAPDKAAVVQLHRFYFIQVLAGSLLVEILV